MFYSRKGNPSEHLQQPFSWRYVFQLQDDRQIGRCCASSEPLGATVYFRKMPFPNSRNIRTHKTPINTSLDKYLPPRVLLWQIGCCQTAVQSSDENLGHNDCSFGPVRMNRILGRAIYFVHHYENYIYNGAESLEDDYPIVKMKLENETIQ